MNASSHFTEAVDNFVSQKSTGWMKIFRSNPDGYVEALSLLIESFSAHNIDPATLLVARTCLRKMLITVDLASLILLPHLERAKDTVQVYVDFARCYGNFNPSMTVLSAWHAQQFAWSLAGSWKDLNKDFINRFFAERTGCEVPPPTLISSRPPKPVYRYFCMKAGTPRGSRTKRQWSFLNSFLHGLKKGMPVVPDEDLRSAVEGMRKRLTQKKSVPFGILDAVRRTARDLFGPYHDKKGKSLKPHIFNDLGHNSTISVKSCVESTCGQGGALAYLLETSVVDYRTAAISPPILSGVRVTHHLGNKDFDPEDPKQRRFSSSSVEFLYSAPLMDLDRPPMWSEIEEELHAVVLPEPFKARMVTVNTFASQSSAGNILRWMRRGMARFQCLRLTREEISIDAVNQVVVGAQTDEIFRSADFSAATDEFPFQLTEAAVEEMGLVGEKIKRSLCAPKTIKFVWGDRPTQNCFSGHLEGPFPSDVTQSNGQLMGCMYSFPILCAVNLAIIRMAFEIVWDRQVSLDELPVLVNGDDLVFRGTREIIDVWEILVRDAGLVLSPGKNYDSRDFVVMNSHLFPISHVRGERGWCSYIPYSVDYVNMGLLTGRSKGWAEKGDNEFVDRTVQRDGYTLDRVLDGSYYGNLGTLYGSNSPGVVRRVSRIAESRHAPMLSRSGLYSPYVYPHLTEDDLEYGQRSYYENLAIFKALRESGKPASWSSRDASWLKVLCRLGRTKLDPADCWSVRGASWRKMKRDRHNVLEEPVCEELVCTYNDYLPGGNEALLRMDIS